MSVSFYPHSYVCQNEFPHVKAMEQGSYHCCYDTQVLTNFSPEMLDLEYWWQRQAVVDKASGRGTTWFVKYQNNELVLRHYYRGGAVGRIIRNHYLFFGVKNTRAVREFTLLKAMYAKGLPVPRPIAFRIHKTACIYTADIMLERISGARDLVEILKDNTLSKASWFAIGQTIKKFHDLKFYHHDLNAHNIMLDSNDKVWVIDFDRGRQMAHSGGWARANLQRLLRSFRKEKRRLSDFNWSDETWSYLIQGYSS